MKGIVIKVYMVPVKPKELDLFQRTIRSSADDSQNLIVSVEELKTALSKLNSEKNDKLRKFLKDVIETLPNEVNYIWFYL